MIWMNGHKIIVNISISYIYIYIHDKYRILSNEN